MSELSEGELLLRFEQLRSLALDLASYTQKRRVTQSGFRLEWLVRPLIRRCRQKQFELTKQDVRWVLKRAAQALPA